MPPLLGLIEPKSEIITAMQRKEDWGEFGGLWGGGGRSVPHRCSAVLPLGFGFCSAPLRAVGISGSDSFSLKWF